MSKEIAEEYASSLADLTMNSKPLINMLTILAEENIDHAGTIVETVEKHLEKVNPEIKLPVLYLVDSIIKNVGGAYTQKFSQSIVNMFTRTFKQVDEKVRSQMFKLRETWHDVFPATKLYQLDVKVNLIDPAWPIQAQPQQSNIHVNPNFLKKPVATTSVAQPPVVEDEKMKSLVAKKEHELLMLQRKKIEMELEQTRKQLELAENNAKKIPMSPPVMPVAMVNPVMAVAAVPDMPAAVSIKSRLGPPVNKQASGARIAPVSGALVSARRDPRLARQQPAIQPIIQPAMPIAPNVFDIKPLERVTKRKNVITIDVRPEEIARRRDPRLEKRLEVKPRREKLRREERRRDDDKKREVYSPKKNDVDKKDKKDMENEKKLLDSYIEKLQLPDPKKINKLPPIPKKIRDDTKEKDMPSPIKRKKELVRIEKKKKRDNSTSSKESLNSSPEKKSKIKDKKKVKQKEEVIDIEMEKNPEPESVSFKELKNYNKDRYMRRNREKSESPEKIPEEKKIQDTVPETESSNVGEQLEMKDVDLRVLPSIEVEPAVVAQKRPSTETLEGRNKKNKIDKFDILFGNEDVDLRQLPQVEEVCPPPPAISDAMETEPKIEDAESNVPSPLSSPKKDWNEVKEKTDDPKKTPSKLDLVRAKLAEATKGKDRLGRPLLFSKSPSIERERRRTISSEDVDLRAENGEEFDAADHKKTISIIMSQAKEQFSDGQLDRNQYNTLMFQVLQLNEKLKLKEAKQRESLEISKRKLKAHIDEENHKTPSQNSPNGNRFGDIDERLPVFEPDVNVKMQDSDMRLHMGPMDNIDGPRKGMLPRPPIPPSGMFMGPYPPMWRGHRPRMDEFGPRRPRGPIPPFFRGNMRPNFNARMPNMPHLPIPKIGMCQGESPLKPYDWTEMPPPLGAPGFLIPPTDVRILEYIDQDPMKSTQIDGVPREIRFYGDTAVIMLDWDDPREIKFLPGSRRVTFDNKDSIVLNFNEGYKSVEIDDQTFDIKFGSPTRELYINGRWHECLFGGQPVGVIIDGKPRLIHLEGPLPQVDIGKPKRTDLVAGKVNLIIDATNMSPVYLDAKVQKFHINDHLFTIRFADALTTVLINEVPFKVEFGGIPKPIFIGNERHFVKFSGLPRHVKPGFIEIANMEGRTIPMMMTLAPDSQTTDSGVSNMETDQDDDEKPVKSPSPDRENQDLDILASVMPSTIAPASGSEYNLAEPLFSKPDKIPGLETSIQEEPAKNPLAALGGINVNDLFAKLVATGIVQVAQEPKKEEKEVEKPKKEDSSVVHKVDLLRPETLRGKQPGVVSRLYGGMQCSGCGCRFPPEQTVRYSQHLDWHFRQNRRERDSARRPHSRHWHYDLSDWLQYEELDDLEEREKSWFEKESQEGEAEPQTEAPPPSSVPAGAPRDQHCSLCGDKFQQFYNEDREEWHLRNAVNHEGSNYHPACFEDFKASQTKEETKDSLELPIDKVEDAIEIAEDEAVDELSDNESDVEVVDTPQKIEELEIDEGDEDDVVLKADPVEQVVVEDEYDTDDETSAARAERDRLAEIDFSRVKIKQEPIDPDDEPIITAEEQAMKAKPDTTQNAILPSIDGNIQFEAAPPPAASSLGIRINISKTIPAFLNNNQDDRSLEDVSVDDEPLPPGEEPELEYKLKPSLEGVVFSRQPPVRKGKDLSGLCSIM